MVKPASKERESWCQPFSTTSPPESAKQKSCRIASLMFEGGTNTETFLFFVREILVPALWKGAVVVMDNLKHTNVLPDRFILLV